MAIVNMSKRTTGEGYEYSEVISDGSDGDTVLVPDFLGRGITCTLIAGVNTGKFQVTTSPQASVLAGTESWADWSNGNSTGTVNDVAISSVTAIRGVSISGEITIELTY